MNNGIYILKAKDQCRAMYINDIESLYFSYINFENEKELVPTRLIEIFGNGKCENFKGAMKTAIGIKDRCGEKIHILRVNKTWGEITKEARKLATEEIKSIEKNNDGRWNIQIFELKLMEEI